jgi:hypothetical protein
MPKIQIIHSSQILLKNFTDSVRFYVSANKMVIRVTINK